MQQLGFKEKDEIIITINCGAVIDPKYTVRKDILHFRTARGRFLKFSAYGVLFNPWLSVCIEPDTQRVFHIHWKNIIMIEKVF